MNNSPNKQYSLENVLDASPVKSFFVSMLTRDIQLEEAILDLLDNCVDGILRSTSTRKDQSFKEFHANIEFSSSTFSISDNCGGIPSELLKYAFRMGRPVDRPHDIKGSIGVYGIGMKRAIFKIGTHCRVSTGDGEDQYEIEILPEWISDETSWKIPVKHAGNTKLLTGTKIEICELHNGIVEKFSTDAKSFEAKLRQMIATHYAYIIAKGFSVSINGSTVTPRTTNLRLDHNYDGASINPFIYQTTIDDVHVFLAVGFNRPIPNENEQQDEQETVKYSSMNAGWTILCNDRVVVYCDRSELTGWGEAGVPRYHTQFIAIAGIVEFKADDPSKLPTTTTKRGIDASSPLFLQVKNKMREGMRMFTNFTNQWKGNEDKSKEYIERATPYPFFDLKTEAKKLSFRKTKRSSGKQFKPKLPSPKKQKPNERRIAFTKEVSKIDTVADYLGDANMQPSDVGEKCFDILYLEAKE